MLPHYPHEVPAALLHLPELAPPHSQAQELPLEPQSEPQALPPQQTTQLSVNAIQPSLEQPEMSHTFPVNIAPTGTTRAGFQV